tara:strand:- start:152 stop:352 length:201 start_codon:yes stop_codon:yes gene_type:complete
MKVITHKFREKDDTIKYAVNLVDITNRPLKTYIVPTKEERRTTAQNLATENNIKNIFNNSGFSLIE